MGEIFRRETAKHPEPFTGERLTTAVGGQVQIEHYHRYLLARSRVAGLDVLDVASGEGYGSALLAQVARFVVGIEYSGPTARAAATNFPRSNLCFVQGDARRLPLADRSIDTVVSFETIEHFDRQADFLREIQRVLRPEGSLIVSTPDRDTYSPAGSPANPFHVQELSRQEFVALLRDHFRYVQVVQQRALIGSAALGDAGCSEPPLVFDRRGETHFEACMGLPRAPYLIAVASNSEPQPLPPSLYIDRSDLDTETLQRMALAAQLQQARAELTQAIQSAEQSNLAAEQACRQAEQATRRADRAVQEAEQTKQRAEQATLQATLEGELANQRAHEATQRADLAEARIAILQRQHDVLRGSLRTFLRGYLPLLRRYLFGQRP